MKRMTRQRQAIVECFKKNKRPLSVEEVLKEASKSIPQLNLATVYRNVKLLIDEGQIVAVDLAGGSTRYELVDLDHHHHFLCQKCDRLFDIPGCPSGIGSLVPKGFQLLNHTITLNGYCASCLH
jgi:Fur family ferric uptake transcriptional regulator